MTRSVAGLLLALFVGTVVSGCSAEMEQRRNREMFEHALKKAERGDRVAAFHVGSLYRDGIGTARDPEKALSWYELGGPHGGWAMIGEMYDRGDGVPRDPERAASYYRRAAETGEPVSMYRFGCVHAEGRVAAPDGVEGYMWLLLAQKVGERSLTCHVSHYSCREWAIKDRPGCRARLAAALTPAERAEAERRAAAWLATRPFTKE
jgi:uncharacterized protein